jgi:hypothetical protein
MMVVRSNRTVIVRGEDDVDRSLVITARGRAEVLRYLQVRLKF